jgi:hypothetical protein
MSLLAAGAARAETVLPRIGPLPVLDQSGAPLPDRMAIPFGTPLTVIDRRGGVLIVTDDQGRSLRVRETDTFAPPPGQGGLTARATQGREASDRPDLPLWDSAARGRMYLQGAPSDALRPALTERPGGRFPEAGLPVFALETAPTTVGQPVLMAGAWFPVMPEALDPEGRAAPRRVVLHVLVDGSDYARDFTLDTLRQLSRGLQADAALDGAGFTRQVYYDTGAVRDEGEVPVSGLRAEWPTKQPKGRGDLTSGLAAAVATVAEEMTPGDGAAHLVLVLAGPGLSAEPAALDGVTAAGQRLADLRAKGVDLRGVLLLQGTPEPNPANDTVLARLAGGAESRALDFGANLAAAVTGLVAAAPAPEDAVAQAARQERLCTLADSRALPCIVARPGALPPAATDGAAPDWVALPLWFVLDGAALDLVPAGAEPATARAAQDLIRTCHASGQVWNAATALCAAGAAPAATASDEAAEALRDELDSAQAALRDAMGARDAAEAELAERLAERDAALADLADRSAEWADSKAALEAEVEEVAARLSAAEDDLSERADRIAALEEEAEARAEDLAEATDRAVTAQALADDLQTRLSELEAKAKALALDLTARDKALDQAGADLLALRADHDDLAAQLAEAQDQAADLTVARDAALAELAAAEDALRQMTGARDTALADLAAAREALSAMTAERDGLSAALDAAKTAAAQAATEAAAARDALQAQLDAAKEEGVALSDRVATSEAEVQSLTAARDMVQAALDDATARLAAESAARATAETALAGAQADMADTTAKLTAAQAEVATLTATRDDLAARLAEQTNRAEDMEAVKGNLSAAEAQVRSDFAKASRELAEAVAEADRLTKARDEALARAEAAEAALTIATAEAKAASEAAAQQHAELETKLADRDALAARLATAEAEAVAQGQARIAVEAAAAESAARLAAAEAEIARLTAEAAQLAMVEDMQAMPADASAPRPKPRPDPSAPATKVAEMPKPAKTAKPAPAAAPKAAKPAPAPEPEPVRSVAPSQLRGCQFQWVGKEGRLVCP